MGGTRILAASRPTNNHDLHRSEYKYKILTVPAYGLDDTSTIAHF